MPSNSFRASLSPFNPSSCLRAFLEWVLPRSLSRAVHNRRLSKALSILRVSSKSCASMRMSSAPLTLARLNVAACAGCFVVSRTNAATSSTVQARGSAGLSVASMSEPESSLREEASESDDAARRRRTGLALDSESDAARRDLRFGEELESESEDLDRRRVLRF